MRGQRDLLAVCAAAVVSVLVVALVPWEPARVVAVLPFAVFLPGYSIVAAAFGSKKLDPQRTGVLVLMCGLATLCIGGVLLDLVPGGIDDLGWTVLLLVVTFAAAIVAAVRRAGDRTADGQGGGDPPRRWTARLRVRPIDSIVGAVAIAAAVAALVLAYTPLPAHSAEGFTSLWVLPGDTSSRTTVRVGVASDEQEKQQYVLRVRAGSDAQAATYDLTLSPGTERVFDLSVQLEPNGPTRVAATLSFRSKPQEVYRRVLTWLRPVGE